MKRFRIPIALVVAWAIGIAGNLLLEQGTHPRVAHAAQMTSGDSVFTGGGSFKIYPLFTLGGAHIHSPQFCTVANGFLTAQRGYIYTSAAALRINIYRGVTSGTQDRDTSGFTLPSGSTFSSIPDCDSINVVVKGATTVTWGLFR